MITQFSESVSEVINFSKEEANRLQNPYIEPEHILLGLLRYNSGIAIQILLQLNVNLTQLKEDLENYLRKKSETLMPSNSDILFSDTSSRVIKLSIIEAGLAHQRIANTEHILLAILREENSVGAQLLISSGVTYNKVLNLLPPRPETTTPRKTDIKKMDDSLEDEEKEEDYDDMLFDENDEKEEQPLDKTPSDTPMQKTPFLDKFGIDMTKNATEGKYDPVIGRENEILRLEQILCRRKKNNPILIGEPGVGKSAIVEGLAQQIVEKRISHVLFNKRIVQLNMASVVAGTKYRGQFEERMQGLMKELQSNADIILFIDEIHTIIGAGSTPGTMDAANILKPALARGDMQCIGATTIDEYRKNIEKDGALDRRFQKVLVNPTTPDETIQILKNVKGRYEDHHNVTYTDEAIDACVKLTDRYISDRNLPDKAIDALDEAGSRIHITNVQIPLEIEQQQEAIKEMIEKKKAAVKSQNFELAASYRDKERTLNFQLTAMQKDWEDKMKSERKTVSADDISNVVSAMSGIPVQRIAQSEGLRLQNLKTQLQSVIVAQDAAIDKTVKAILRNRVGLKDPNKPIGTFLFLGPTGVGKTYLTKELAKLMFGSEDALIRIDMSEYMEKYAVSRLIGAPPGYVGYDEGGQLTERVKRRPYSIVLFDEIEKAHPDVFNLLLQIMDEGRLTDSYGVTINFKNTIIIMTSNVGTRQIREFGRGIGFSTSSSMSEQELSRSYITKALNKTFAPEFINRIDEIITFDQLSKEAILKIVDIELNTLSKRIESLNYKIIVDDAAKAFLADKGYDVQFGARPLKRVIQNYIEDNISETIVSGKTKEGDTLLITHPDKEEKLSVTVMNTKSLPIPKTKKRAVKSANKSEE